MRKLLGIAMTVLALATLSAGCGDCSSCSSKQGAKAACGKDCSKPCCKVEKMPAPARK